MHLLIGIPALNEEIMIGEVLQALPKELEKIDRIDVLVVDDGSGDATGRIAKRLGVIVLRHIITRGLGGALKTILAYAKRQQYDLLVTLDADGQHRPDDIHRLLRPILHGKSDIVIGTRWKRKRRAPLERFIINQCANFVTSFLFGVRTSDSQSGFRALNSRAIRSLSLQSDGMEVSSEFFREVYRHKLRFSEVSIAAIYTRYSRMKGQKLGNSLNVFFQMFLRSLRS